MYTRLLLIFGALLFVTASCENNPNNSLPGYSGNPGEIIVVVKKSYWSSSVGDSIRALLGGPLYGLPQPEPTFGLNDIDPAQFNRLFNSHRNLLTITINPTVAKSEVRTDKSRWSKGQIVVEIVAHDLPSFFELFAESKGQILAAFRREELKRIIEKNSKFGERQIAEKIKKEHGISLTLQKDIEVATEASDFVWLRLERERQAGPYQHQISQGLLIYHYPYTDTSAFDDDKIMAYKDSITKKHLPGPSDGSYMAISRRYIAPITETFEFRGAYAKEMKGLWRMENDFMGGPFTLLSVYDEKLNRIVVVEGYVYAPQFDKREYLREVEAMIKSLELVD